MGVYRIPLANRRMILLAVLSLIASLLTVGFNAPQAGAAPGDINVSPTTVNPAEGGATDSFTITLGSSPLGNVTIGVSSGAETTLSTSSVVLDSGNWNTGVSVVVTAVDDNVDDDAVGDTVVTGTSSSPGDPLYDAKTVDDVTVNITDNDDPPTVSIADGSLTEANGTMSFTVTRNGSDTTAPITFDVDTSNGSATAGADYTAVTGGSGSISTGAPGTTTVSVPILEDTIDEGASEAFTVTLSGISSNASFSDAVATGTITDDDDPPTVSIADGSLTEANGTMSFTVTRNGSDTTAPITFDVDTSNGSATAGADYTAVSGGSGSISTGAPGTTTVSVPILEDTIVEGDEDFTVTLSGISSNASFSDAVATGTILDDDVTPTLTITSPSITEADTNLTFVVGRSGSDTVSPITFNYTTVATGSATAGADYTTTSGSGSIPPTGGTFNIDVPILEDAISEADETFEVSVSVTSGNADPPAANGVGEILDDDVPGVIITETGGDTTVSEPATTATYTITLATEPAAPVTITPSDGGSTEFNVSPASVILDAGNWDTGVLLTVTAVDDDIDDGPTVGPITHTAVSTDLDYNGIMIGSVSVTVNDDDVAGISVSPTTVNVAEGQPGGGYTITLDSEPTAPVTVNVANTTGEATVSPPSVVLNASNWNTGVSVAVVAFDDPVIDGSTSDTITNNSTSGDSNYNNVTGPTVAVNVSDNDSAGVTIVESDGNTSVLEGGAPDTYTLELTAQPTNNVTVNITTGSQVDASPTSVVFTPATWDDPQTITVTGVEDGTDEVDPHSGLIEHSSTSGDALFNALSIPDIIVSVGDADALLVTIEGPSFGAPGTASTFTAMVNAGGTGTITYAWTVFLEGNQVATGNEATFQFTPTEGGTHIVSATVGDDQGQNPAVFINFTVLGDIGSSVFVADIVWLAEEGITRGCNPPVNDEFCPDKTVTRGQMAAFLVRFLGLTAIDPTISFTDTSGNIFEQDILKLATAGITRGCNAEGTQFCPDNGVTRGQMAAFLVRAFGLVDDGGGDLFVDDDDSIFEGDIDKLATAGITRGCNPPANTNFCPASTVTRGQMAAFLHRAEGFV